MSKDKIVVDGEDFFKEKYKKLIRVNSKITLRQLKEKDVEDMIEYSSSEEFRKYLNFQNYPTKDNILFFINSINKDIHIGNRLYWGIEIDKKIIGTIGFLNINKNKKEAELGFGISPKYWGKGIINQCMNFLIHLAFNQMEFNKLIVGTINENIRTIEFSKKEGFLFDYKTETHTYLYLSKEMYEKN